MILLWLSSWINRWKERKPQRSRKRDRDGFLSCDHAHVQHQAGLTIFRLSLRPPRGCPSKWPMSCVSPHLDHLPRRANVIRQPVPSLSPRRRPRHSPGCVARAHIHHVTQVLGPTATAGQTPCLHFNPSHSSSPAPLLANLLNLAKFQTDRVTQKTRPHCATWYSQPFVSICSYWWSWSSCGVE